MNFKEQYTKAFENAAPSAQLQQETLELMQEARDHKIQKEAPPPVYRKAGWISLAATAAAVLLCVVLVGLWLRNSDPYKGVTDEEWGDHSANNIPADPFGKQESTEEEQENVDSFPAGTDDAKTEEDDTTSNSIQTPTLNDQAGSYGSFRQFLQALTAKSAPGYGKNYYLARELLILPDGLPEGARFYRLDLTANDGGYQYSYDIKDQESTYRLTVTVSGTAPRTLTELNSRKEALATETIQMQAAGNLRTYQFGATEQVTVTLSPAEPDGILPDQAQTDRLLTGFSLARCALTNPYLDMVY